MDQTPQEEIAALLRRKAALDLDQAQSNRLVSYDAWLVEAVALLLILAMKRGEACDAENQSDGDRFISLGPGR